MLPDKLIPKDKKISTVKLVKASPGHVLPIFYKGSIIRIGETDAVEIDLDLLQYEPKHQLTRALALKNIIEIGE